jgi:hypothetical protein
VSTPDDLAPGVVLTGRVTPGPVEAVPITWHGSSLVRPLPHQIEAVYHTSFDPGAGFDSEPVSM